MSDTIASLQHKIHSAQDLQGVVRTMKAMAASNINQYENSVLALDDYYYNLQIALLACFKTMSPPSINAQRATKKSSNVGVLVFGSDQGLVGQFNETMSDFVVNELSKITGEKKLWVLGERLQSRLSETNLNIIGQFTLPVSVTAISSLVGNILLTLENHYEHGDINEVYVFHHQPTAHSGYQPLCQRLLPLDKNWQDIIRQQKWPNINSPEVINGSEQSLLAFVHEYLFVSIFRACAESLASENSSRLSAMQRAEKNIDELLEAMQQKFHQRRQTGIDEELFDLVSGFEALES